MVQVVLELFLEKAQATGSPDADSPAMVALGADRGTYRELPAAEKCVHAAHAPSAAAMDDFGSFLTAGHHGFSLSQEPCIHFEAAV